MISIRPYAQVLDRLKSVGLRPTRQRLALAKLLFEDESRHVTAEQLHGEAIDAGIKVSLATVYNSLHQFTKAKLLREVVVESGRAYFDTNTSDHHHLLNEDMELVYEMLSHIKHYSIPHRDSLYKHKWDEYVN